MADPVQPSLTLPLTGSNEPVSIQDQLARLQVRSTISNNVLHNVGNVLTSVCVAADMIEDQVKGSRLPVLSRVLDLFQGAEEDVARFLVEDPRGKTVLPLLRKLHSALDEERSSLVREVESLRKYASHVQVLINKQQNYSAGGGVAEMCEPLELMQDAVLLADPGAGRHRIQVDCESEIAEALNLDKHLILQILVNLISNAKHALRKGAANPKRILIRALRRGVDWVVFEVQDNGPGIAPEVQSQMFQTGFTTREGGRGFGLSSSVNVARQVGGDLTCVSAVGEGACFVLEVPVRGRGAQSQQDLREKAG